MWDIMRSLRTEHNTKFHSKHTSFSTCAFGIKDIYLQHICVALKTVQENSKFCDNQIHICSENPPN